MKRRNFIKSVGQLVIATGLISTSAYLLLREKSKDECKLDFACQNCSKAKGCELPEAKNNRVK